MCINTQNFPEDDIIRLNTRSLIEANFMATIKEADYLKHKSQIINSMQKKEHNQLWLGLQNDKFDQFWAVNRKLMELVNNEPFKYIPIRFYKLDATTMIQQLIKPVQEDGAMKTLNDVLNQVFPDSFENDKCKYKIIVHGLQPPLETPIHWLSEHLSYPDNFLHLSLFENAAN